MPSAQMRSLSRHIDVEWLREAHRRVRKDGAVGVDGQTAEEYAKNLESNLESLLNRAKSGDPHAALSRKLRGHDGYYGITGNARALSLLRLLVRRIWHKWLNRRSWKTALTWTRMNRLLEVFPLPPARVVHSVYRSANP
jgi:hypothetical protein